MSFFVNLWQAAQQSKRVRVPRVGVQFFHFGFFNNVTTVHNHHPMGDIGDHAEVMGDSDNRHPQFISQPLYQIHDLCLNSHIERRGRFIGNQNLWIAG